MSTAAARATAIEPAVAGTLTAGLVSLIRSRPVAQSDLDAMALMVLDGVANMLAGRATEPGQILRRWGADKRDAGRRALVMGGCMHILEVDDLHRGSVTHPGCVVIPAALALAGQGRGGRRCLPARGAARLRGGLPGRHVGRPDALQGVAQHRDLRAVRRRDGGRRLDRARR